jgi:hypothetical protein
MLLNKWTTDLILVLLNQTYCTAGVEDGGAALCPGPQSQGAPCFRQPKFKLIYF